MSTGQPLWIPSGNLNTCSGGVLSELCMSLPCVTRKTLAHPSDPFWECDTTKGETKHRITSFPVCFVFNEEERTQVGENKVPSPSSQSHKLKNESLLSRNVCNAFWSALLPLPSWPLQSHCEDVRGAHQAYMLPTSKILPLSWLSLKLISFPTLMLGYLIGYNFISYFFPKALECMQKEFLL